MELWQKNLVKKIDAIVSIRLKQCGVCRIMLTGGRAAKSLYENWRNDDHCCLHNSGIEVYFTDERAVTQDHPDNNCRMVIEALYPYGVPVGVDLRRMKVDVEDLEAAAVEYENHLPDSLDIIILSIGDDGHIASLFPYDDALFESQRLVVPTTSEDHKHARLTITPKVIKSARNVFVLAIGTTKRSMYEQVLNNHEDFFKLPASLVLNRDWVFER